jgi:hypothetical protein
MFRRFTFGAVIFGAVGSLLAAIQEYKSGIVWPEPPVVTCDERGVPSDAIVLFDGTNLDAFKGGEKWEIKDGYATVRGGGVTTKQSFGDLQMHIEFASPEVVKGNGQGRGNSGVYLMGRYEVQILDSFENATYFDGQCASVYKQQPPMVNACKKPGEWQTYDIIFTAPKFDAEGKVTQPAYLTLLHNGVLVHNHFALEGSTSYTEPAKYSKHADKLPISIQDHGNPVRYRNIWIRENVSPLVGKKPEVKAEPKEEPAPQPKEEVKKGE